MYSKKDKIREIISSHYLGALIADDDIESLFEMVSDILEEEASQMIQAEPHATVTYKNMMNAAREVRTLGSELWYIN
jgi:hypothetical protein